MTFTPIYGNIISYDYFWQESKPAQDGFLLSIRRHIMSLLDAIFMGDRKSVV